MKSEFSTHRHYFHPYAFPFLLCALLSYIPMSVWSQESKPASKTPSFKERRMEMLQKFDANHDGRLDSNERETMRQSTQNQESKQQSAWKIPEKFLAKYDKDKDGDMSPDEWGVAWQIETDILTKKFDKNANGTLEKNEIDTMMQAVSQNVITGVPAFFAMKMAEDRPKESNKEPDMKPWKRFDFDGDGQASAEELKALRQALKKK